MNLDRLPDYIIIGASRSGTSSLFYNLVKHPYINGPLNNVKELHFFDSQHKRGLNWYNNHFPERGENMVHLEATPNYLYILDAPQRAKELMPKTRFIVMLRNPIDRTWSDYWTQSKEFKEVLWHDGYFDKQGGYVYKEAHAQVLMNPRITFVEKSIYVRHLERWFEYFARDNFLILKSEEFFRDEHAAIKKCFEWMKLYPIKRKKLIYSDIKYDNLFGQPAKDKRNPKPSKHIFSWLKEYFEPYNKELHSFLGKDFGWKEEKAKYE